MRDLKATAPKEPTSRWLKLRVQLLGVIFLLLLSGIGVRAIKLQIFERDRLEGMARDQYIRHIEVPARRGDIFDRRGAPLAQSVDVDSIWVDPSMLPDPAEAARSLAAALNLDARELTDRLLRARRFAWVKRQARPDEVERVKALGLAAIGFTKEPRRFYPQRELAAHVVGMTGTDGRGLEGLELAFNDELSGENARVSGLRDARGRKLLTQGSVDPLLRQGARLTLTLDRHLQYVTEKALAKAVTESKAVAGMAVVMDPTTGELLALANFPGFNPNTPRRARREVLRNRAALDTFEPGSTFKPFVIAAALEERAIKTDQIFYCEKGRWRLGRHTLNDTHPYEWLTPQRILQVSSNICTTKIAQVLGRERLSDYYARFGFGQKTGLALPGEGRGVVPYPKAEISLATQSFGQGLTTTTVQLTAAFAALANGGVLMRPYLVSKVEDPDGVVLLENQPTKVRQVVSPEIARKVVRMMETVVDREGTAPKARMEDYRVAGKTGTAQKADPVARGYSDKRIASFVGVVPAEAPRVVISVIIDEPQTDVYGGLVAAPAFREIATAAMPHLGVPPSKPSVVTPGSIAEDARVQWAKAVRPSARTAKDPTPPVTETVAETAQPGAVRVPDVGGRVGREAIALLLDASLEPRLVGSGRVVVQRPPAGALVEKGTRITVELKPRQ